MVRYEHMSLPGKIQLPADILYFKRGGIVLTLFPHHCDLWHVIFSDMSSANLKLHKADLKKKSALIGCEFVRLKPSSVV